MSWHLVDDKFWCHEKVDRLDAEFGKQTHAQAIAMWVLAGSYLGSYERDIITLKQLRRILPWSPVRGAKALVTVGLWDAVDGGFVFHDHTDWQTRNRAKKAKSKGGGPTNNLPNNLHNKCVTPPTESLGNQDIPTTDYLFNTQGPPKGGPFVLAPDPPSPPNVSPVARARLERAFPADAIGSAVEEWRRGRAAFGRPRLELVASPSRAECICVEDPCICENDKPIPGWARGE